MNYKFVKADTLKQGDILYKHRYNIFEIILDTRHHTEYMNIYRILMSDLNKSPDHKMCACYDMFKNLLIEKLQDGLFKI